MQSNKHAMLNLPFQVCIINPAFPIIFLQCYLDNKLKVIFENNIYSFFIAIWCLLYEFLLQYGLVAGSLFNGPEALYDFDAGRG